MGGAWHHVWRDARLIYRVTCGRWHVGGEGRAATRADANMNDMFAQDRLALLGAWLDQEDHELRAYAALCISNLARTGTFAEFRMHGQRGGGRGACRGET